MIDIAGWFLGGLILLGLISLLVLFQHRFIYFPLRYSTNQLDDARTEGVREVKFQTTQGRQVAFFWHEGNCQTAPQNLWLVFGGNGDVALAWMSLLRAFPRSGSGYLLIDYPGYGLCPGNPNPQTILETSQGALQALLESEDWKIGGDALCVLGHSLGGAAALQFAAKNPVRKVVVVSTFTTMGDMVRRQIRIPLGRLLRHRFDNVASLKAILSRKDVPEIWLFHGEADEIIPAKMGQTLANLDPIRIRFYAIPGARHNDLFQLPLSANLRTALFDPIVRP